QSNGARPPSAGLFAWRAAELRRRFITNLQCPRPDRIAAMRAAIFLSAFCCAAFAQSVKPAAPVPASPYEERDIKFTSASVELPGTLTLPTQRTAKLPLVVLVAGSGPQDRDETIGPNKPFRDLARG